MFQALYFIDVKMKLKPSLLGSFGISLCRCDRVSHDPAEHAEDQCLVGI